MRSRYSAYVERSRRYLLETWHPTTRPADLPLNDEIRWLGLTIKNTTRGLAGDLSGTVEFFARYRLDGRGHRLHEISEFIVIGDRWYYLGGKTDLGR